MEAFEISLLKAIFVNTFETSSSLVDQPCSRNCSTVSVTVLGELKNELFSKIASLFFISEAGIDTGLENSGSWTSASSKESKAFPVDP